MRTSAATLVFLMLFAPVGWAQSDGESAPPTGGGGPNVQQYLEVERGFWLRTDIGFSFALNDVFGGTAERTSSVWPPGPMITLEMGYDLGQVASLHLALLVQQVVGSHSLAGGDVSNDAAAFAGMVGGRFNLVTTKRLGWFVKAEVGYLLATPARAGYPDGLLVQAGTGIEYATSLRHFFVGIEVLAQLKFIADPMAIAVALNPHLKYVF